MKHYITAFFLFLAFISCNTKKNIPATDTLSPSVKKLQDSLAFELCQLYGLDQGVRQPFLVGKKINWPAVQYADSISFLKLVSFVKHNGFPSEQLLGNNYDRECVAGAAIVVLLHNPHMVVNNKEYRDIFIGEVKKGSLSAEHLAMILDKYYWVGSGLIFITAM